METDDNTDPLHTLLATIARLDREASAGPWHACCEDAGHSCRTGLVWVVDGETCIASGPGDDCVRPTPEQIARNTILIAFSRNTLAPLASMLRVAVEAMERYVTRCDVEGCEAWATWHSDYHGERLCDDHRGTTRHHLSPFVGDEQHEADARAALATIRRMAEEVERG